MQVAEVVISRATHRAFIILVFSSPNGLVRGGALFAVPCTSEVRH
jgi:hypothetical protein